ncbi:hypothetical protein BsWGS_24831 [Bradybaena similaris]
MNAAYLFLLFAVPLASIAAQPARVSREADASGCQREWERFGDSCYGFGRENVTWPDAMSMCRAFQGYLVEINSKAENDWLVSQLKTRKFSHTWLGASDMMKEGVFRWMTNNVPVGKVPYFHPGQPDNREQGEQCLEIDATMYMWADDECLYTKRFVCEKSVTV